MTDITAHHGLLHRTKLHVDDTGGSGRPVVLIHGWPLSGESWSGQVPAFSDAGYRAVTYDRRGFGRSEKPHSGYDYDTFADDLHSVLEALDLRDVTLVGFSMGGGEVARYLSRKGAGRIHSVVFAAAVTPYLAQTLDNPDGPLTQDAANEMESGLKSDPDTFYPGFVNDFYSANGELKATQEQVDEAVALCKEADHTAALKSMEAFGTTDFRNDLPSVSVPALVIHGDADAVVPFSGSGKRTWESLPGSTLKIVEGGPHGINVTNTDEFNAALLEFFGR